MKSPSKKPAKPFMEPGMYLSSNGIVDKVKAHEDPGGIYRWVGEGGTYYTDNGCVFPASMHPRDLIARVSIRVVRRNPHLKEKK